MNRRNRNAFTLVELLVVITIIAILIALLLAGRAGGASGRAIDGLQEQSEESGPGRPSLYGRVQRMLSAGVRSRPEHAGESGHLLVRSHYMVGTQQFLDVTGGPLWPYLQVTQMLQCPCFMPSALKYVGSG